MRPLRRIYSFIEWFYSTHEFTPLQWQCIGRAKQNKSVTINPCFGKAIGQHLCRYSDILKLTRQGTFRLQKLRLCWPNTKPGAEFSFRPVWNLHNRRSLGGEIGKVFYCQIICCAPLLSGIIHKYSTCQEFF